MPTVIYTPLDKKIKGRSRAVSERIALGGKDTSVILVKDDYRKHYATAPPPLRILFNPSISILQNTAEICPIHVPKISLFCASRFRNLLFLRRLEVK